MFPDSAWADEARRSSAIKPLSGGSTARRPKDAFEEKLLAGFYPDYGHLFFDATNTLLPMARSEAAQPGAAQFSHLLDEDFGPRCAGPFARHANERMPGRGRRSRARRLSSSP